jgi:uncharacterized protein YfbU (UPF0304 family)
MTYARFIVNEKRRFESLSRGDDFNSHMPVLDMYRRMVRVYNDIEPRGELSPDEIRRVLEAARSR